MYLTNGVFLQIWIVCWMFLFLFFQMPKLKLSWESLFSCSSSLDPSADWILESPILGWVIAALYVNMPEEEFQHRHSPKCKLSYPKSYITMCEWGSALYSDAHRALCSEISPWHTFRCPTSVSMFVILPYALIFFLISLWKKHYHECAKRAYAESN